MTDRRVVLDTWAWWELFGGTTDGRRIETRFFGRGRPLPLTSAISLGELSAKITARGGSPRDVEGAIASVRARSKLLDVTPDLALRAGMLREQLRVRDSSASLADAIVLQTARQQGARLVSHGPAFAGEVEWLAL